MFSGGMISSLLLLPLAALLCLPCQIAGQAECQLGGAYYFGGENRDDAIGWSLTTKDYYDGAAPGVPRWYAKLQLADTDLWQRNPYIRSVFFERYDPALNSWLPLFSWMGDYAVRDTTFPSVPLTFDGRTNPGEIPDNDLIEGSNSELTWRVTFRGGSCPPGTTSPVTMPHYGFTEGGVEHRAVASGLYPPRTMPDSFHFAGAQDNSLCAPGGIYATTASQGPDEWMDYMRATKLPDCRWQIDLNLKGDIVNHPYMEFISMRFALTNGVESTRLLLHFPGQSLKTIITERVPCDVEHMNVRLLIFFDELDSTSLINADNSCGEGLPPVIPNFCIGDGVQYSGADFLDATSAECESGLGSDGVEGVAPTPTPTPPPVTSVTTPGSGYQDACVCNGFVGPVKQQCFEDPACATGGLGCFGDSNGLDCRFCGWGPFPDCPGSATVQPTAAPRTAIPTPTPAVVTLQPSSNPPDEIGTAPTGPPTAPPTAAPSATPPPTRTPTPAPVVPDAGGAQCQCNGRLPNRQSEQCYADPSCGVSGSQLGCYTDPNSVACRFCGWGPFVDCPQSSTTPPTAAPPTAAPVAAPTAAPVAAPTAAPVAAPTAAPVAAPTAAPVAAPTAAPVAAPTAAPVAAPTAAPVAAPTAAPVAAPTAAPVAAPTAAPVAAPTAAPTAPPTAAPVASGTPCLCEGRLPNGEKEQCYADPTCPGLGCYTDSNNTVCRFCGYGPFVECPQ